MIENAESIIKWAMEIADDLPEEYQVAAFAELVRCALSSAATAAEPDAIGRARAGPPPGPRRSLEERLASELPEDYLLKHGSREQQTVWATVKLWQDGLEATSKSVREVITTRLGVTPESETHTSDQLRGLTPKYLKRGKRKKGPGYAYTPTASALEVFEGLGEGAEE